jgi:anti-sigma regulatory factor (Ser/Thr protein kinase)
MTRVNSPGETVRRFIIDHVEKHPGTIAKVTAEHFKITRQAVSKHLQKLTGERCLTETGNTRNRIYKLAPLSAWNHQFEIVPGLAEDVVWSNDVSPALGQLPDNVKNIWHHGFTEMFNNAIDHSEGKTITVQIIKTAASAEMMIRDDGIGIFKKIQNKFGLLDARHAILELSKGKLTTDPKNHSGEGIFFTSRMFDEFEILSGGYFFSHQFGKPQDWMLEANRDWEGTAVYMRLHNHTSRTAKKVFDAYVSGEDFDFTKTVVPVDLARYGNDKLLSRSQAKRVLARVELFKTVVFDFKGVESIGQAFSDEIFRVFANAHPDVQLHPINTNSEVRQMISRARNATAITPSTTFLNLSGDVAATEIGTATAGTAEAGTTEGGQIDDDPSGHGKQEKPK